MHEWGGELFPGKHLDEETEVVRVVRLVQEARKHVHLWFVPCEKRKTTVVRVTAEGGRAGGCASVELAHAVQIEAHLHGMGLRGVSGTVPS